MVNAAALRRKLVARIRDKRRGQNRLVALAIVVTAAGTLGLIVWLIWLMLSATG
jgi:ferric-dicitrate binding protein FerR (iron transport regulator)